MKFKNNFFRNYLYKAPLPLALERNMECGILSKKSFNRPILDIGCGDGIFASTLFDEKIDVGIDPNQKELVCAANTGAYQELIQCYGDNIPKQAGTFATIFSNSVMEHIPDIQYVLKEAHRLLQDNGVLYLTLPTNYFDQYSVIYQLLAFLKLKTLAQKYRIFFNRFWAHYHYYDKNTWVELFEKSQFKVTDVIEYGSAKICGLNDFLAPFSFFSFLNKKIRNTWFFNSTRRFTAPLIHACFKKISQTPAISPNNGGLIFFELRKI